MRVWNDEEIAPNTGFALQAHANIEIIIYVREGTVTHRDSLGNEGRIETGNVQVVSAGTGIRHAEYNWNQFPHGFSRCGSRPLRRVVRPPGGSNRVPTPGTRDVSWQSPAVWISTATHCPSRSCPRPESERKGWRTYSISCLVNRALLTWCLRQVSSMSTA